MASPTFDLSMVYHIVGVLVVWAIITAICVAIVFVIVVLIGHLALALIYGSKVKPLVRPMAAESPKIDPSQATTAKLPVIRPDNIRPAAQTFDDQGNPNGPTSHDPSRP